MATVNDPPPAEGIDWAVVVAFGMGFMVGMLIGAALWSLVIERQRARAAQKVGTWYWWVDREQECGGGG